jgi:hypothetical protein
VGAKASQGGVGKREFSARFNARADGRSVTYLIANDRWARCACIWQEFHISDNLGDASLLQQSRVGDGNRSEEEAARKAKRARDITRCATGGES